MTTINRYLEKEAQSTYIYKKVDTNRLGIEVYEETHLSSYSFYLVRKLKLNRDYTNVSEQEKFFEEIFLSWKNQVFNEEMVLKKIYRHTGLERVVYTLEIGCDKPLVKNVSIQLKQWLANLSIELVTSSSDETKAIEEQIVDTSSDIFDLTQKITHLRNNFFNDNLMYGRAEYYQSILHRLVLIKNRENKQLQPIHWGRFSSFLHTSKQVISYRRKVIISVEELKNLEDSIYFCFVKKQLRKGNRKKLILREQLIEKVNTIEYVPYLWVQVYIERKEDILICNRLSCAGLISSIDELVKELKISIYHHSLFGKYVRCSENQLDRLEGYILLEQFLQKFQLVDNTFYRKR